MNLSQITLVLGIDKEHATELRLTWPTWIKFKPELLEMPLLVFYDPDEIDSQSVTFLHSHPNARFIPWRCDFEADQRTKMLTGWIRVPAREVHTPWYLKLDTDVVATKQGSWIEEAWFQPNSTGKLPVFISSKWSYSKPSNAMELLDAWADQIPDLCRFPRLNIPFIPGLNRVYHPRIISWLFFCQTSWAREMSTLIKERTRPPLASHDTFLFYCAKRRGDFFIRKRMTHYGWRHQRIPIDFSLYSSESTTIPVRHKRAKRPRRPADYGVIYYNTRTSCAVRLLVSLYSLRQHYHGPVTILTEGDISHRLCFKIGRALNANVKKWNSGIPEGKNKHYLVKTNFNHGSPYRLTIALDSDTLVVSNIDSLFDEASKNFFCVAQFSNWTPSDKKMTKRIMAWRELLPEDINPALSFQAAINLGMFAFRRDAPLFEIWMKVALAGRSQFIPDEISCQILLPRFTHRILDAGWNRSCRYDDINKPQTKIIHYHGRKHCRKGLPYGGDKWMSVFKAVYAHNLGEVATWAPADDRTLRRYLQGQVITRDNKPTQNQHDTLDI